MSEPNERAAAAAARDAGALLATVRDRLRGGYVASESDARLNALRVETAKACLELAWLELELERRVDPRAHTELRELYLARVREGLRPHPASVEDGEGAE